MIFKCLHSLCLFSLLFSAFLLVACGEETESIRVTERYTLDMLGKGVSLTEEVCDSARVGQLLYVGDSSSIYYCTGRVWKKVNGTDGRDGRDGQDGADGTDGKRGKYGTSGTDCFVDEFADGFVLGCGATKAIIHYDFEIPDTCSIELDEDSSYVLRCGDEKAKLRQGAQGDAGDICRQTDIGGGQVRLVCGSDSVTTYKAQCGEIPFDPDGSLFCYGDSLVERCNTHIYDIKKQFCYGDTLIDLCGGNAYELKERFCYNDSLIDLCNGKDYDIKQQFCLGDSIIGLCGGKDYELSQQFCYNDSLVDFCGGKDYDLAQKFCYSDSIVALCGGRDYDIKQQFCYGDTVIGLCSGEKYDLAQQFCYNDSLVDLCDGKDYDLAQQFCFSDSLVDLCGGEKYTPTSQFCYNDSIVTRCNGETYNLKQKFCYKDSLVDLCGGKDYDLNKQFCYKDSVADLCSGKMYDPYIYHCKNNIVYGVCDGRPYGIDTHFCDDRDGRIYKYTVIGGVTWMAQNLDYKVPNSFCDSVHKDDNLHCGIKGRFYPWNVAMAKEWKECGRGYSCGPKIQYPHQGVCPDGWHLPTIEEWGALRDVMGTYDLVYWDESVVLHNRYDSLEVLTNEYGFSAIPTGIVNVTWNGVKFVRAASYEGDGNSTIWSDGFDTWSSTEANADKAELCFFYSIGGYGEKVDIEHPYSKESTRTVRCVRD